MELKTRLLITVCIILIAWMLILIFAPAQVGAVTSSWYFDCNVIEHTIIEGGGNQSYLIATIRQFPDLSTFYDVRLNRVGSSNVYRATNWVQSNNVEFGRYWYHIVTAGDGSWWAALNPPRYHICYDGVIHESFLPIIRKED